MRNVDSRQCELNLVMPWKKTVVDWLDKMIIRESQENLAKYDGEQVERGLLGTYIDQDIMVSVALNIYERQEHFTGSRPNIQRHTFVARTRMYANL